MKKYRMIENGRLWKLTRFAELTWNIVKYPVIISLLTVVSVYAVVGFKSVPLW